MGIFLLHDLGGVLDGNILSGLHRKSAPDFPTEIVCCNAYVNASRTMPCKETAVTRMLSGVIRFTLLNLLLAVVNWIDIKNICGFHLKCPRISSLMDFVHSECGFCLSVSFCRFSLWHSTSKAI
jgi:hypothetical protein